MAGGAFLIGLGPGIAPGLMDCLNKATGWLLITLMCKGNGICNIYL